MKGCGRPLCRLHKSGVDPRANYVKLHRNQVCVECVGRVQRFKVISIALLIIFFLVISGIVVGFFSFGDGASELYNDS